MSEEKSNETALDREVRRFKNMPIVVWVGLFAMVVGVAAHFLSNFVTLSEARKELFAEKPALVSVSYSRLFGASQVQYVLRDVAGESQIDTTDELRVAAKSSHLHGVQMISSAALLEVIGWNFSGSELHSHLAEADPVAGPFSKMLAALGDENPVGEKEALATAKQYINQSGSKLTPQQVVQIYKAVSAKVAFLIIEIQNDSKAPISNVRLRYRSADSSKFKKRYLGDDSGLLIPDKDRATIEAELEKADEKERVIPSIEAGSSVWWLLEIYEKGESDFTGNYLGTVERPTEIIYDSNDGEVICDQQQPVRRPLEDRAAKVMVPFGWSHQ